MTPPPTDEKQPNGGSASAQGTATCGDGAKRRRFKPAHYAKKGRSNAMPELIVGVPSSHAKRMIWWLSDHYGLDVISFTGSLLLLRRKRPSSAVTDAGPVGSETSSTAEQISIDAVDTVEESVDTDKLIDAHASSFKEADDGLESIESIIARISVDPVLCLVKDSVRLYPIQFCLRAVAPTADKQTESADPDGPQPAEETPEANGKSTGLSSANGGGKKLGREKQTGSDVDEAAIREIASRLAEVPGPVRLQAFPRSWEASLADKLEELQPSIAPTPRWNDCKTVASIVRLGKRLLCGVSSRQVFEPYFKLKQAEQDMPRTVVSRAYHKLHEVVNRGIISLDGMRAGLDVGAAPGGWSQRLAEDLDVVLAVDPAAMGIPCIDVTDPSALQTEQLAQASSATEASQDNEPSREMPNEATDDATPSICCSAKSPYVQKGKIYHARLGIQKTAPQMEALGPFDIVACDMNVDADQAVDLLRNVVPHMSQGAYLILTIKMFVKELTRHPVIEKSLNSLGGLGLERVKVTHLFANKRQEFTIVAKLK